MTTSIVFVVRLVSPDWPQLYLADTCAGGAWFGYPDAKEWRSLPALVAELADAEIEGEFEIVTIVRVRP